MQSLWLLLVYIYNDWCGFMILSKILLMIWRWYAVEEFARRSEILWSFKMCQELWGLCWYIESLTELIWLGYLFYGQYPNFHLLFPNLDIMHVSLFSSRCYWGEIEWAVWGFLLWGLASILVLACQFGRYCFVLKAVYFWTWLYLKKRDIKWEKAGRNTRPCDSVFQLWEIKLAIC